MTDPAIRATAKAIADELRYDLRTFARDIGESLAEGGREPNDTDTEAIVDELKAIKVGLVGEVGDTAELVEGENLVDKFDMLVAMLGGNEEGQEQPAVVRIATSLERIAAVAEKLLPVLLGLTIETPTAFTAGSDGLSLDNVPDAAERKRMKDAAKASAKEPALQGASNGSEVIDADALEKRLAAQRAVDAAALENLAHEVERSQNGGETLAERAMRSAEEERARSSADPAVTARVAANKAATAKLGRHPARRTAR